MKLTILTATILALAAPAWAIDNTGPQSVQLRFAHDHPGEDYDRMELDHRDQSDTIKEMVYVDRESLADQSEIKSAQMFTAADGTPRIELSLTDPGNRAPLRGVRRDAGKSVALVVGGRVVATGEIMRGSNPEKIDLAGEFTRAEAQRAVDGINQAVTRP